MAETVQYAPATDAEVREIVAQAVADKCGLEVCGGGSKRLMRAPVAAPARLELRGIAGITDYDADELVVTARAGTPLAEIESALREREQMLAFEPFDHGPLFGEPAGRATLGGIVAANVSGSRRLSFGAARDHILGFTAVTGRGATIKGGGAVVKNVTGFDLPKLMAGSWGTLAVLVSITLRVLPRPRTEATLLFKGLTAQAANRLMGNALATPTAISGAVHLRRSPESVTALRLEGFGPSVQARCRELTRTLASSCAGEEIGAEESAAFWTRIHTLDMLPLAGHALFRVSVPPARGWEVESRLAWADAEYAYDWGGALVFGSVPDQTALAQSGRVREVARALGGHAQWVRAPQALHAVPPRAGQADRASDERGGALGPASAARGVKRLHERLKSTFDPAGILNPGVDLAAEL